LAVFHGDASRTNTNAEHTWIDTYSWDRTLGGYAGFTMRPETAAQNTAEKGATSEERMHVPTPPEIMPTGG
jgi:hypothetical protein